MSKQGVALTEAALLRAIEMARGALDYKAWTVGITDNPGLSRAEHGNPAGWRWWQADGEITARRVEQGCLGKGMKASAAGAAGATCVYVF